MSAGVADGESSPRAEVIRDSELLGAFVVRRDGADQSWVDPEDPTRLEFDYMRRIATHLDLVAPASERIRIVHIGGAGMSLARYVAATRPTSAQVVLEPDKDLTDEVRRVAPLSPRSGIKVRAVDGRSGMGEMPDGYTEVVIIDAFVGQRVPGDLATVECFAEVRRILADHGTVLMNVTDSRPFGWTRRVLAGLARYFPRRCLSAESSTLKGRRHGNIVLAGSRTPLPLEGLSRAAAGAAFPYRLVSGEHLQRMIGAAQPFYDTHTTCSPARGETRLRFD